MRLARFSAGILLIMSVAIFVWPGSNIQAAFNSQINYQGKLTDTGGSPVIDGNYIIKFRLYTSASGATTTNIWEEIRTTAGDRAAVTDGLFSVMLGSSTPLTSVNFNQPLYLGVEVCGTISLAGCDGEMTPRKVLGVVPAAFEADKLDGLDSTAFILTSTTTLPNIWSLTGLGQVGSTSATTTFLGNIAAVGQTIFSGLVSAYQTITASSFTATSTTASIFPYASTTALTVSGTNGLTLAAINGPLQANGGVVSATTSIGALYGGTGSTTLTGLLKGNGTGVVQTAVAGTDYVANVTGNWTGTFDGQEGSYYLDARNLTSFGSPFYNFFSATTTDALTQGSTNLYYDDDLVSSYIASSTTLPAFINYWTKTGNDLSYSAGSVTTAITTITESLTVGTADPEVTLATGDIFANSLQFSASSSISHDDSDLVFSDETNGAKTLSELVNPTTVCVQDNALISGGIVTYSGNGFTFDISPATYCIQGLIYQSTSTKHVTLDTADASFDRIDTILANTNSEIAVATGTPAITPSAPSVDSSSQIALTIVFVGAGTTQPGAGGTGPVQEKIYLENAGTEWTGSEPVQTPVGVVSFNSTANPQAGSRNIEVTTPLKNGHYFQFATSSVSWNPSGFATLSFYIKVKTAFTANNDRIVLTFRNTANTQVGSAVTIQNNTYGFNRTNTTDYQKISIPLSAFGALGTSVKYLRFTANMPAANSMNFRIDNIVAEGTTEGSATTFTLGSVLFAGTNGVISESNPDFFWNNTTKNLGLGTTSPYAKLSVVGQVVANYFTATSTTQASTFPYASTTALTVSGTGTTTRMLGNLAVTGDISADQLFLTGATSTGANGFNISSGCYAVAGVCLSNTAAAAADWNKQTNFGALTLTPTTTISIWSKSAIYASSSIIAQGDAFATSTIGDHNTYLTFSGYDFGGNKFPMIEGTTPNGKYGFLNGRWFLKEDSTGNDGAGTNPTLGWINNNLDVSATVSMSTTTGALAISSSATTTADRGIDLSAGCFAINGTCIGVGSTQWTNVTGGINYSGGKVGIGSSTPFAKLSVDGDVRFQGSSFATTTVGSSLNYLTISGESYPGLGIIPTITSRQTGGAADYFTGLKGHLFLTDPPDNTNPSVAFFASDLSSGVELAYSTTTRILSTNNDKPFVVNGVGNGLSIFTTKGTTTDSTGWAGKFTDSSDTLIAGFRNDGAFQVPGFGGSGNRCLHTDNTGLITAAAADCGSGGGGGGTDVNWTWFNGSGIQVSTTTNQVVIGASGTSSLAKLEVTGNTYLNGDLGISTTSPWKDFSVDGNMVLTGGFFDSLSSAGSNGFILQSTGSATKWLATSTLGIALSDTTGTLGISRGGTNATSFPTNALIGFDGTRFVATGTPQLTIGNLVATSSANSTFVGNVGIATTSPYLPLAVAGSGIFGNNVRASNFTATSTTASIFPYASTTAVTISGTNGLVLSSLNGPLHANAGVVSATTSIGAVYGGTGSTTLTGLLKGNGTGVVQTAVAGVDYLASAITALGPTGQTQTGSTVTLATSTSVANGVTSALTVTGSGNTLTFTPSVSGTLSVAGGGTGLTTFGAANKLLYSTGATTMAALAVPSGPSVLVSNGTTFSWSDTLPAFNVTGNIIGSGTNVLDNWGQIVVTGTTATSTFSTGGLTVGTNQFVVQQSGGFVGIGTSSPYAKLSVAGQIVGANFTATSSTATTTIANDFVLGGVGAAVLTEGSKFQMNSESSATLGFSMWQAISAAGTRPVLSGVRTRGTLASPTAVQNSDSLFAILAKGTTGSGISTLAAAASIEFKVDGTPSTNVPGLIQFQTASPSASRTSKMQIYSNGQIAMGSNFSLSSSDVSLLTVKGTTTDSSGFSFESRDSSNSSLFSVRNDGNVGIGTTSPYAKLSVSGETAATFFTASGLTSTSTFAGNVRVSSHLLVGDVPISQALFSSAGLKFIVQNDVSTSTDDGSPIAFLSTKGSPNDVRLGLSVGIVGSPSQDGIYLSAVSLLDNGDNYSDNYNLILARYGSIDNVANVGIGTTTPWRKLSVASGGVAFSGLPTTEGAFHSVCINPTTFELVRDNDDACTSSSERFKHDIQTINVDGLDVVNALQPKSYVYNEAVWKDEAFWGFMAEDIATVDEDFGTKLADFDEQGRPQDYHQRAMLALLVDAIQELYQSLKNLTGETLTYIQGTFEKLTAKEIKTEKLCVGSTCVTEEEFLQMVQNSGANVIGGGDDSGNNDDENNTGTSTPPTDEPDEENPPVNDDPVVDPAPEPAPEPSPVVEDTPVETPPAPAEPAV